MAQHFFQRAAVAAANDHHPLGVLVGEQRRVGNHLVVEEVVAIGQHHAAIQHHQVAVGFGGVHFQVLVGALHIQQFFGDFQRESAAVAIKDFGKPLVVA